MPEHIVISPSELSSFTFPQVCPRLELDAYKQALFLP